LKSKPTWTDQKMEENKGQIMMSWRKANSISIQSMNLLRFWKGNGCNFHTHCEQIRIPHRRKHQQSLSQDIGCSTRLVTSYSTTEAQPFLQRGSVVQIVRKELFHCLQ
jgi:hypothetical protein